MSIFSIGVFATFIIYLVVGNYAGRKVKSAEDYYVVGRKAPTVLIVGTLVASYLSTVAFMGEVGFVYDGYAIPLLILIALNACGYVIGAVFFGRYIRRSEAMTVTEYFGDRFNSPQMRVLAASITIVGIGAYLVAVTQGASLLMSELLGVSYGWSLIIVWIVYTSFTFYSGSQGVVITDTIMFFLFTVMSFIAVPFIINASGGWPDAFSAMAVFAEKPDSLAWHGLTGANSYMGTPADIIVWGVVLGLVWAAVVAVSPWQTSRYLMAKNEHTTIRSSVIASITVFALYMILMLTVPLLNLLKSDIAPSETAFIWAAINVFPSWLGIIVVTGIMAAALSSCSTFLSLVGFSVSRDIIQHTNKFSNIGDKQMLTISRAMMLLVGLVTLIITYFQPPAVMWIGYFAATLFAASWGPIAFISIFSKRVTAAGAFWGMLIGFIVVAATEAMRNYAGFAFPVYFRPPILGAAASIIAIYVASALTTVTAEEKAYREKLFVVPEVEKDPAEIKRTMAFPKLLIAGGIALFVIAYVFYYIPFSQAAL
jgi:sodium/pantothenate symporter